MDRKLTKQENPMEIFLSYSFIFFYLVGGRERGWKENGERKEKWDGKYFFDLSRKVYLNVYKKKKNVLIDQDWGLESSARFGERKKQRTKVENLEPHQSLTSPPPPLSSPLTIFRRFTNTTPPPENNNGSNGKNVTQVVVTR
jgi:hypothetical protein